MWREGSPPTPWVGMETGAAMMENSMEGPQKLKTERFYDRVFPLLTVYPEKTVVCIILNN